jgi:hypothetical protein
MESLMGFLPILGEGFSGMRDSADSEIRRGG